MRAVRVLLVCAILFAAGCLESGEGPAAGATDLLTEDLLPEDVLPEDVLPEEILPEDVLPPEEPPVEDNLTNRPPFVARFATEAPHDLAQAEALRLPAGIAAAGSLAFWIAPSGSQVGGSILALGAGCPAPAVDLRAGERLTARWGDADCQATYLATTPDVLASQRWTHVVLSWNVSGDAILFVDGDEVARTEPPARDASAEGRLQIGGLACGGLLHSLFVADRPLYYAEIQQLAAERPNATATQEGCGPAQQPTEPTTKPVPAEARLAGWWTLDEEDDERNVFHDSSGRSVYGKKVGSPLSTPSPQGEGYRLDGESQFLYLPNQTSNMPAAGLLSFHVRVAEMDRNATILSASDGCDHVLLLRFPDGGLLFAWRPSCAEAGPEHVAFAPAGTLPSHAWTQVEVAWGAEGVEVRLDGDRVVALADGRAPAGNGHLTLGAIQAQTGVSGHTFLDGAFDDVRLHDAG